MNRRALVYGAVAVAAVALGAYFLTRNLAPEPMDDRVSVAEGRGADIDVLANDKDPDGDSLRIVSVTTPAHGSAVISPDEKRIKYVPALGFYGKDAFKYRVSDPSGAQDEASVEVTVEFVPPEFHRRSTSATLAEMLQEPPTTAYGSTINVFLFRDEAKRLREITIAGHADSLTCRETSGAFAGALIDAGGVRGNFLIAGAGRMAVPDADPARGAAFTGNEDVEKYSGLKGELDLIRLLISRGGLSAEAAGKILGMSLEAAQASLDTLSKNPEVAKYLALVRPAQSAETFERAARELQAMTGMLRVHEVPFNRIQAVRDRLMTAALSSSPQIVQFADLLPAREAEAVVYLPFLKLGSGTELTISVPIGEFSPEGFRRAAKIHRSALENAIVGSAEKRLVHAESFLKRAQSQQEDCRRMNSSKLAELVDGLQRCDKDDCRPDPFAKRITNQEYCTVNVPANIQAGKDWKEEAERILARVRQFRERQDDNQIDAMTHAALVDSMLRDWALPIPTAQAAFDYWRKQGRASAWKAMTDAMTNAGVGRAALSGESIVFDVSLAGDMLSIQPLMVVDLKRTVVLIDQTLGVTAPLSSWELRRAQPVPLLDVAADSKMQRLIANPREWVRRVEAAPQASISALMDELYAQLPAEGAVWRSLARDAQLALARRLEEALEDRVSKALTQPMASREEAALTLERLQPAAYAARSLPGIGTAFRLRAATALARSLLTLRQANDRDAWSYIKKVANSGTRAPPENVDRFERLFFGEPGDDYMRVIVMRARGDDPGTFAALFAAATVPSQPTAGGDLKGQPVLERLVGQVEQARSGLIMRAKLDEMLAAFDEDGSVGVDRLNGIVRQGANLDTGWLGIRWDLLRLNLRFIASDAHGNRINPIEGSKLVSALSDLKTAVDGELRRDEPRLAALHFGRDQEIIVARLLFDKGAYAAAFDRLAPARQPLALYTPGLKWAPVDPDLRGVPERLSIVARDQRIVVTATMGGTEKDVLQLEGIEGSALEALLRAKPEPPVAWNEGDPLWQQVLLAQVPSPRPLSAAREALSDPAARQSALKAMVYACAVPGRHLLDSDGRCKSAEGSTALHDRVAASGSVTFVAPDARETQERVRGRFLTGAAWRFGTSDATR